MVLVLLRWIIMQSKGQLEIFGLAIVVILIALAFLFAVQFFLLRPGTDAIQPAKEGALAANFLNSVLGVMSKSILMHSL